MSRKYLSFDLEIAKVVEDGNSLDAEHPLGISCCALVWDGTSHSEVIYGGWRGDPTGKMRQDECRVLVDYLMKYFNSGYSIVTHNGLAHDFLVLAEESGMWEECAYLALHSVDLCFAIMCRKGYPVGLDAVAKGMGIAGKMEGMNGDIAPRLWQEGDFDTVIEYVLQDAICTAEIAMAIQKSGMVKWVSQKGNLNELPMHGLPTVKESMNIHLPDTSWMKGDKWTREKFFEGWPRRYFNVD